MLTFDRFYKCVLDSRVSRRDFSSWQTERVIYNSSRIKGTEYLFKILGVKSCKYCQFLRSKFICLSRLLRNLK